METISVSTATSLFFKVGGSYPAMALTYADKTQETLTSLTAITGLSTNGSYTVVKEKGGNPTSVATPAYGKDLFVDFSQCNANDNYGLYTPTVVGNPTFTGNKFNSNGATGLKYPITTLGTGSWCIQGKFKFNATNVQYSLINGNGGTTGLLIGKHTSNKLFLSLASTGVGWNIADNVQGSKSDFNTTSDYYVRAYFTGTQYRVDWSLDGISWTNDITVTSSVIVCPTFTSLNFGIYYENSWPLAGTMDDLQVTLGQSVCQIKNQVTQGKTFPLYPIDGDYHCLTATGLQSYKRVSGAWVENQYVPLGTATVVGSAISAVSTKPYNQNGYDRPYKYDSGWFAVNGNTAYTKTHNLGTSNIKYEVLIADDVNGLNARPALSLMNNTTFYVGWYGGAVTNTTVTIYTEIKVGVTSSSVGTISTAFYRILAEAL